MRTEDIPRTGPSDWRREPDAAVNAILGKLGEEAGELATRCCRAMIQGLVAIDPGDGRMNLSHLEDEIADVRAVIALLDEEIGLNNAKIAARQRVKEDYKRPWIEAQRKKPHPAPLETEEG